MKKVLIYTGLILAVAYLTYLGCSVTGAGGSWTQSGSDIYYTGGNVGIGTTSPRTKLEVQGEIALAKDSPGDWGIVWSPGQSDGDEYIHRVDGYDDIRIGTQGTDQLVIDSDGNVGIGTTNPASGYKLDVEGNIQATAFDVGDITFRDQKTQKILWRMFEDESGLYLENIKTGKIYRFVLQELDS